MKHGNDRIFSVPFIDLLCWKCRAILVDMICHYMEWRIVETSKTLFYLRTVTCRDAPIQIKYYYWTKFPFMGVTYGIWEIKQTYKTIAVPCNKYELYFNYYIQWQQSNDGASNCSVTVMDGINTQFWANLRIQDLHHEWKIGICASLVPQIHYNSLQRFLPCRKLRKEWLSTRLVVPLEWINAVWAYIKN